MYQSDISKGESSAVRDLSIARSLLQQSLNQGEYGVAACLISTVIKISKTARAEMLSRGDLLDEHAVASFVGERLVSGLAEHLRSLGYDNDTVGDVIEVACQQFYNEE